MGPYDTTMGALFLGIIFNTFLYGLLVHQFVAYQQTARNDSLLVKCMVLFLFILDTFHSVSVVYMVWNYLVTNHGNPAALEVVGWPYSITPVCTALAALVTQMLFAYRICLLAKNKIFYVPIASLAVPAFVLALACSVKAWNIEVFSDLSLITTLVIAWLSTQVSTDALITVTLIIILSRSRIGTPQTDTVLDRLTRCAIQTGLLPALSCIAVLVTFVAFPTTYLHCMFAIPVGRIYTNTLLYTLLIRESIKADLAARDVMDISLALYRASPPNSPVEGPSVQGLSGSGGV